MARLTLIPAFLLACCLASAQGREAEVDVSQSYFVEDVLIPAIDGAKISARITRPRSSAPLPTLLEFTIYVFSRNQSEQAAARGYAGVVAYSRGKRDSPDEIAPYEHDGKDACAVIEWISKQPWSDGRVAMYGASYSGFTQWAAAKHRPAALKAIATAATAAPGIDIPMEGNIFLNFTYQWAHYVTNNRSLDDSAYNDSERWRRLNREWYVTGQPYRALERIDGHPNRTFARWLDHPEYDAYWRRMIPYGQEFAGIDIPVLATTGYDDGGQVGVLYYFNQHHEYNARADHTLLIGPYDHFAAQRGVLRVLRGYEIDPVAHVDLNELRMQWLDYVLKGAPKPALLRNKVNYQVMGSNEWKHASSLRTMASGSRRFYLVQGQAEGPARLAERRALKGVFLEHAIDFAERRDVDYAPTQTIVSSTLDTHNGIAFVSDPLQRSVEVSGLFSAELEFVANKKDMDVKLALYELMPSGEYFELSQYMRRLSYSGDRSRRRLLNPGQRTRVALTSEKLTSRRLHEGSRVVLVLSVNKQPDMQINYGTGADVSDESIEDAGVPLRIRWYGGSYIDLPVSR